MLGAISCRRVRMVRISFKLGTSALCSSIFVLTIRGWHQKFFFVSSKRWEFPLEEEDPVRVQHIWGVPFALGNASYPFLLFSFVRLGTLYNLSFGGMSWYSMTYTGSDPGGAFMH